MANHRTHLRAGAISGAIAAAYCGRAESPAQMISETLGGAIGGALGAQVPDLLEPALHSWHRSTAHSATAGVAVTATGFDIAQQWLSYCRRKALEHSRLQRESNEPIMQVLHSVMAWLWATLAGVAPGIVAGYLSHLALDACTPRSIPIFG